MEFSSFTKLESPGTSGHNLNICRICLQKNHNSLVSLFDKHKFLSSTIASVVFYVAGVEILRNDLYPQFICNECLSNIQNAAEIKKKCIESDLKLKSNWLHPEFELKQEKEDVDDYYDQNDFADSYNDESEFMDFPKISVEPIEVKTEKREVKKEDSDEDYIPASYKRSTQVSKSKGRPKNPNGRKKPTPKRKNEKVADGNVCRNCSKKVSDKYALKRHQQRCKRIYYFCEICEQTIKYKSDFEQHIEDHKAKGDPPLSVCDCNEKLYTRDAINEHPCLQKANSKIFCGLCNTEFVDIKEAFMHCRNYRKDGVFKCTQPNCLKIFKKAKDFYYHIESHFNPAKSVCGCCGMYFDDRWQLSIHRAKHKGSEIDVTFICDYCGKGISRRTRLLFHIKRYHMKVESSPDFLICDQCSQSFKNSVQLQRHQIKQHGATGDYQCHLCGEWFIQQSSMAKHMKSHNKPEIVCNICQLSDFKNAQELKIHVELVHNRVTKHQCPTCFKSFKHAWHLDSHKKIHTGEKDFPCSVCFKAFITKPALSEHMRMHTGEMPYACNICPDKRYRSHTGLRRHYKEFHKLTQLPKLCKSKPKPEIKPFSPPPPALQNLSNSRPPQPEYPLSYRNMPLLMTSLYQMNR